MQFKLSGMNKKSKNQPIDDLEMEDQLKDQSEAVETADIESNETESEQSLEEELTESLEKEKEKFLRLFAEFENYKKRTTKERMELFKTAGQEVMTSLLPVLDDFDRALTEIGKSADKELFKGVELIHNKFRETLKSKGLEEVNCKQGDAFDAEIIPGSVKPAD